mgnify:CR=1 FL=1
MLVAFTQPASAAISVTSSTASWTAISYAIPSQSDPSGDQQTGSAEGDIVGNATHASLYTSFDNGGTPSLTDGEIGFRMRLGADASPAGLKTVIWVGIDANGDGKVDLFAGALEDTNIGFYPAGTGLNTSPNTTSIVSSSPYAQVATSASNFNFSPVNATIDPAATNFNLDAGTTGADPTDQFVSFKLDFSSLVTAVNGLNLVGLTSFDENTPLRYIAATSQQANSLNQDLNGINDKTANLASTWTSLGGFTNTYTSGGVAVPEPSGIALLSAAGLLLTFRRRNPRA